MYGASLCVLASIAPFLPAWAAEGAGFDEEILVVAPTPNQGAALDAQKLPFTVQAADEDALERAQTLDLADFLGTHLGSVNINSAQNNPLQPDVQYRGFAASPLLGLSQGIAVYQNGARINDPFGDVVHWDLLPESAVQSIVLVGGSNPLFGLNALGGALAVEMKDGFNFESHQAEIYGGAWQRLTGVVESGSNNGVFGYYVNLNYFEEEGWRDISRSNAASAFTTLSYRGDDSSVDVSYQFGDTRLRGNGPAPVGLLDLDRSAIFTAPDITENLLHAFTLEGTHDVSDLVSAALTGFYRSNVTDAFNGDSSELLVCQLAGGDFLLETFEDDLLGRIGREPEDLCVENELNVGDPAALERALNALPGAGLEPFNVDDLTDDLSGSGVLTDAAINNTSTNSQDSYGVDVQFTALGDVFERANYLVFGSSYFNGTSQFDSVVELAGLDPVTRSTAGRGVGTFIDREATSVETSTATWSVYAMDSFDVSERITLTFGARYNDTRVEIDDRSGVRPELEGEHDFSRLNPTAGATFEVSASTNVYASYSESSRAPTPIELACNDGVFQIARDAASARGDDPEDVDFECRLPNAFLADPPLAQVVAKTYEFGLRGDFLGARHRLGYFRTSNQDDIIFQTTGRGTGLFANVDQTRRQGFESAFAGSVERLDWSLAYSYIRATFEDDFLALSPNHPLANAAGEIAVRAGDVIPGIPQHQLKWSSDYSWPLGIRVGGEVIVNSAQFLRGDESNQLDPVSGYTLVNIRASYALNERFEFFARVTNVFDTDYENFGLLGESPAELLPGIGNQTPIFLGAGAPRGGWVGLRMRL